MLIPKISCDKRNDHKQNANQQKRNLYSVDQCDQITPGNKNNWRATKEMRLVLRSLLLKYVSSLLIVFENIDCKKSDFLIFTTNFKCGRFSKKKTQVVQTMNNCFLFGCL